MVFTPCPCAPGRLASPPQEFANIHTVEHTRDAPHAAVEFPAAIPSYQRLICHLRPSFASLVRPWPLAYLTQRGPGQCRAPNQRPRRRPGDGCCALPASVLVLAEERDPCRKRDDLAHHHTRKSTTRQRRAVARCRDQ